MSRRNRRIVEKALENVLNSAFNYLLPVYERIAEQLISDADSQREYTAFTGNTLTSYTVGIYYKNKLEEVIAISDHLPKPVRGKLKMGEVIWLENPYEGEPRERTGYVDVDGMSGAESALDFLKHYKFDKPCMIGLVMTTGTEYSSYLEDVFNINVLTLTSMNARQIFLNNIQRI